MAKSKKEKQQIIKDYTDKIERSNALYIMQPSRITPNEATILRKKLHGEQATYNVVKNTLFVLALEKMGISYKGLELHGENAVILAHGDPSTTAKIMYDFIKDIEKGEIRGGYLEDSLLVKEQIEHLATLPSREELLAKTVGTIGAPLTNFMYALHANISQLITVLQNVIEKKQL